MNLYVMRHGTTVWNEKEIMQGRRSNRLSKHGIMETEKVANAYRDVKFDIIICSPLMRTVQTANIMNQYHHVKIIKDARIIELEQGIFTGRSKLNLTAEEQIMKDKRVKESGMESYEACYQRMKSFLIDIKEKYKNSHVLIITHKTCATFIEDIINHYKVDFTDAKFLRNFKNAELKSFAI